MKLIRISTTDQNAIFDNSFNTGIDVPARSKIALQNLSIELDEDEIVIDNVNNRIIFQFTSTVTLTARIANGTYFKSNLGNGVDGEDLLYEIEKAINKTLTANGNQISTEFKVSINQIKKVEIQWKTTSFIDPGRTNVPDYPITVSNKVTRTGTAANGIYTRDSAGTDRTSYLYSDKFMSKGAGCFQINLRNLAGTGTGQIIFGMTTIEPSTIASFTDDVFKYAICAFSDATTDPDLIKDGTRSIFPQSSPRATTEDDTYEISISQGLVNLNIYDATDTLLFSDTYDYDYTENLYPVIVFAANGTTNQITNVRFSLSPYQNNSTYNYAAVDLGYSSLANVPNQGGIQSKDQYLQFSSITLANFLGYDNTRYPRNGTVLARTVNTFEANTFVGIIDLAQNLIVEMLSFTLDSFDGLDGKRRSILATIPQEAVNNGVQYAPPYPLFIDIDNAMPLSIKNIRCRILKRDLSPIVINGIATICLLVQ